MKYRVLGCAAAMMVVLCSLAASAADSSAGASRVHQHLTARQPDAGCDCGGEELCTHLPLVIIDTGGEPIPGEVLNSTEGSNSYSTTADGEDMLSITVSVMDDESHNHHPSDTPDIQSSALIRIRGRSSRLFDKKGYLLRFTKEDGSYDNYEVMGMDSHYEWALHGPFLDKSLIRNYLWYNIAGEMMDYAPNVRFCEVIINGEYQGLYVMTETITNGVDARVNISEPVDNTTATGYVLRLDQGSDSIFKNLNNFSYYTYVIPRPDGICIDLCYPRTGELTDARIEAITQELSDFEKALYSFDYDSFQYGYHSWVDADSFVDYFIINEFTQNYDAGYLSTYIYKDIGGKYKMCIWDFNNACGNYHEDFNNYFTMQNTLWMQMLMRDEAFDQRIVDRYRMWRESFLNEEYLLDYIDATIAFLGDAINRNFTVWGYSFESYRPLSPDDRNPDDFEGAVNQLKRFIVNRGNWIDSHIEAVLQHGHPSVNKKYNH